MSRSAWVRLVSRYGILFVMLACLLALTVGGGRKAGATVCCSTCEPAYENCTRGCGCDPITGQCPYGTQSCVNHCQLNFDLCDTQCDGGC